MADQVTIEYECTVCNGTGILSSGQPGIGTLCYECRGASKKTLTYTPFTEMHKREDIRVVQPHIHNMQGPGVTYEEFLKGKRPDSNWEEKQAVKARREARRSLAVASTLVALPGA